MSGTPNEPNEIKDKMTLFFNSSSNKEIKLIWEHIVDFTLRFSLFRIQRTWWQKITNWKAALRHIPQNESNYVLKIANSQLNINSRLRVRQFMHKRRLTMPHVNIFVQAERITAAHFAIHWRKIAGCKQKVEVLQWKFPPLNHLHKCLHLQGSGSPDQVTTNLEWLLDTDVTVPKTGKYLYLTRKIY